MSCHNFCSDTCSSGSLRNSCHLPLAPSIAVCSTHMNYGQVFCLPGRCQDHTCLADNCQESCREPAGCQPESQESNNNFETSCYPSTAYYVPRPCQGGGFLPASSFISSSCLPVSYRPLSYVSSSCRPVGPLFNTCQPGGCVSSGCHPFTCLPNSYRPQGLLTSGCRPLGCVTFGPQTVHVVPSSLRPQHPLSSGGQPLTPVCITCRPSCQ
ncbi:keratin-associated protein 26-1-like [Perognathus longimembris pacificus]|uniref:keratin-associated protein 26-1-like n=1 Tax=Perognathus longimembris pacificus TaxID=214514 RepID=UPI00201910B0|nr:keratin-associated protein 26-1-like [Perognathus longimembris pacificus]